MAFGDVLAGWGEAAHQHATQLFQMQQQTNLENARIFGELSKNTDLPDEARTWLMQGALAHANAINDPKTAKQFNLKDGNIQIPVQKLTPSPKPAPIQVPGSPGTPGTSPEGVPQAATEAVNPQTIQPPTPPPTSQTVMQSPLQMLPFEERMQRLRATTQASTKFPPIKVQDVKSLDENGQVWSYAQYAGINPTTGEYGTWTIKSDQPVAYAPRAATGAILNIEDERKLKASGFSGAINNPTPQQIEQIQALVPGARLVHTGYGDTYYVASPTYRPENIGGKIMQVPTNPPAGQPMGGAQESGPATSTLPVTTTVPLPGVRTPSGEMGTGTRTRVTTVPGPAAPTAPTPQGTAAPATAVPAPAVPPAPAPPATVPPQAKPQAQAAPPQAPPAKAAAAAAPTAPKQGANLIPAAAYDRSQRAIGALNEISKTMSKDPNHPDRDTLDSPEFARLIANPQVRQQMAKVFNILQSLPQETATDRPEFGLSLPGLMHLNGLGQYLANKTGFTPELSNAKATMLQNTLGDLSKTDPAAVRLLNTIQSMYTSMPGLRAINLGGAYNSAMRRLETDIPTMLNTASLPDFYNKIGNIARDIAAATEQPDLGKVMEGTPQWKGMAKEWNDSADRYFKTGKMLEDWDKRGWRYGIRSDGSFLVQKTPNGPLETP